MDGQELIRVLIVDDHPILRQGIRQILELERGIEIVGEAGDGRSAVRLAGELRPDLVVMDINMPELNGVEAAKEIKSLDSRIGVLILTIHDDDEYLHRAAAVGVEGYVLKDVAASELVNAVRQAGTGNHYLHPAVGGRLLHAVAVGGKQADSNGQHRLTPREREVLDLIGRGMTNREIADALYISEKTVKNHVSHIFEKLSVSDRLQAVLTGVRAGIISIN